MVGRTKIKVFKGKDKLWYFSLVARNGQIICHSEGYTRRESAIYAIDHVLWDIVYEKNIVRVR